MAAKPPMPPGNLNINGKTQSTAAGTAISTKTKNNSSNNNTATPALVETVNEPLLDRTLNGNSEPPLKLAVKAATPKTNDCPTENGNGSGNGSTTAKLSCSCTNISIMHLFHEMKQEFPTIPDAIVTQNVNENCHQRENCIQMLKKELALHPIPVQSYPAKVLQQQQQQQQQQAVAAAFQQRQEKPPTPLKPFRVAPQQPPPVGPINSQNTRSIQQISANCDSEITQQQIVKDVQNANGVQTSVFLSGQSAPNSANTTHTNTNNSASLTAAHASGNINNNADMPTTTTRTSAAQPNTTNTSTSTRSDAPAAVIAEPTTARVRPTTLNLRTSGNNGNGINQVQRQLNAQLQQKILQRQRLQQPGQNPVTSGIKPLRKAPLPPLPPKPNGNGANVSLAHSQQSSFSNDSSCLTSPISSSESEISLNVSLSSPTTSAAAAAPPQPPAATPASATAAQQPSPIRHRSVITLQPEPPYARDFLSNVGSAAVTNLTSILAPSPPVASTPNGRKSFTSLNLTLRQPNPNIGAAPSTIDITAGPAPNGTGSITYSSSSFDARRGTHKNFQLTVTDEGRVFSAGCVRPQTQLYGSCAPPTNHEPHTTPDGPSPTTEIVTPSSTACCVVNSGFHVLPPPTAQQTAQSQQAVAAMPEIFPFPTRSENYIVASNYNSNVDHSSSADNSPQMPLAPIQLGETPELAPDQEAKIQLQKAKRDKLANALRDNKTKLYDLEHEINILSEPVPNGAFERLDRDIKKLTDDCQHMLNLQNDPNINGSSQAPNSMNRQHSAPATMQPQPRQRVGGAAPGTIQRTQVPPNSLRLNSLPNAQHQSPHQQHTPNPNLGYTQYTSSAPTSACITPLAMQPQHGPPPTYAEYCRYTEFLRLREQQIQQQQQELQLQQQLQEQNNDEEEYASESDADDEEPLERWACNLCTFRNHPQLNICEACENARIKPGMIRIVPSASSSGIAGIGASSAASSATESDASLTAQMQQQQQYALHT